MKIFVLSPNKDAVFSKELIAKLEQAGDVVFDVVPKPFSEVEGLTTGTEERILAIDPDFCNWSLTKADIESIPALKALVLQTTGFDWVDTTYAKDKGINIFNLKGFSTEAVAEWALFMALALARKLPVLAQDNWQQDFVKHQGVELKGKTAGIVGLGNIGTRIAELAHGAGMNVLYWSRASKDTRFTYSELSDLFREADVVFPTMANNAESEQLLNAEVFNMLKCSSLVVSVMHNLPVHELLLEKVASGNLYGYAFEENAAFNKYKGNIFASPEIAWATDGSMSRNGELWVAAILKSLEVRPSVDIYSIGNAQK